MRNLILILAILFAIAIQSKAHAREVVASWYEHGKVTANGEKYDPDGMTVAHKSLPFGTKLRLTRNGKSIIVRVNDRGPFITGREIDLSRGVAKAIGCFGMGLCKVHMEIVK